MEYTTEQIEAFAEYIVNDLSKNGTFQTFFDELFKHMPEKVKMVEKKGTVLFALNEGTISFNQIETICAKFDEVKQLYLYSTLP